ncbi:hypothetical protein OSB04_029363 [Centaurea solstitialis]|uniref:SWIM-type domain-containing protein n=1 Tax=Centaurea solstitialis TaxID=347529 RepID=A0AA38VYQ5_9ASTR|nr:hypothetical protein OSB04_029363 [Centaurea solstitialis]
MVDDFDVSDVDISKVRQLVQEVISFDMTRMYYRIPNMDLENGLKPLDDDDDVNRFISYGNSSQLLEIFVDHFDVDIEEYLNTDEQWEEGHRESSDEDLNEVMVNYRFSNDEDVEVASVDYLSEEDDEIRQVRVKKLNAPRERESSVQENQQPQVCERFTYAHGEFLTELCDEYERESNVEDEVQSDNENEIVEDVETKTNPFPIHNPNVPWNIMKPIVTERYASIMELKTWLTNYALANGLQLRYQRSSKDELLVVCGPQKREEKGKNCPWRLWATWMSDERSFQVKTMHDEHRCGRQYNLGSLVTSNWIAMQYGRKIRQNPSMKLVELKESILKKYKCIVHLSQCARAKAKALGEVETSLIEHYGRLWEYAGEIRRSNPGSTARMSVEIGPYNKTYFQRFYVCFKALKDGWLLGCRRFIGLDGCFLKTICKGELLSDVGRDANNQIYPIAWAVVEVESKYSWKWFLEYLIEDIGIIDGLGVTLMSDQHKGLVEAVKDVLPLAEHRQCARHVYSNFRKKFNGIEYRSLFWAASKAGTPEEFERVMQEIKDLSRQAYDDLMERQPSTWSRAFFRTDVACDAVENGLSECFNSLIVSSRRKPIITMLEEIRVFVMERISKMTEQASKWTREIRPVIWKKIEKNKELMRFWHVVPSGGNMFEVRRGFDGYVVDTTTKTCTSRILQLSGIPCPHAVATLYFIHQDPSNYVYPSFSRTNFVATYNHKLKPLNGEKLWPKTNFTKPLPPMARRMSGRPRRARKKDASERGNQSSRSRINAFGNRVVIKTGKKVACSNCLEVGHNSRSCKNQKKDVPMHPKKPVGRPRKDKTSNEGYGNGSKRKGSSSERLMGIKRPRQSLQAPEDGV